MNQKELTAGKKEVPVTSYDRTCGYYAAFNQVNAGKQAEILERKRFSMKAFAESCSKPITV